MVPNVLFIKNHIFEEKDLYKCRQDAYMADVVFDML